MNKNLEKAKQLEAEAKELRRAEKNSGGRCRTDKTKFWNF